MIEFIVNLGIGVLGSFFFLLWYAREYLYDNTWTFRKHRLENWKRWIWIWLMLIVTSVIYWVVPEAIDYLMKTTNFEIPTAITKVLFLGFGIQYARIAKNKVNKVNIGV